MAMTVAGVIGATPGANSLANGAQQSLRLGNMGDLVTSDLHGGAYEAAYRKTRFGGANQASQATTAAFALTYTGLVLYNPFGNGYNAVLDKVGIGQSVASANAAVVGLMFGYSTTALSGLTALSPKSKNIGSGVVPTCGLASAATLPIAPTLDSVLGYLGTAALTAPALTQMVYDIDGGILVPPGGFVALYTSAVCAGLITSFAWEEVPV